MRRFGHKHSAAVRSSVFRLPPSAFTLVELLVVITIISMLMGLLLPAVQSAREAGRRATCLNGEKQLATAMLNYESSRRSFPGYANWIGQNQTIPASWVVALLPYLEKTDMYNLWASYGTTANSVTNTFAQNPTGTAGVNPYMKMLVCPSDTSDNQIDAWCSYVCNRGCNGWNRPYLGVCLDQAPPLGTAPIVVTLDYITAHDGSSATLLLGESLLTNPTSGTQVFIPRVDNTSSGSPKPSWGKWTTPPKMSTTTPATNAGNVLTYATSGLYTSTTYPGSATNDMEAAVGFEWSEWSATPTLTDKLLSRHPGGVVVSFCDGHQQFIANTVSVTTFAMLMTPYGNGIPMSGNAMATTLPWDGCPGTALAIPSPPVPLPTALLDESSY